MEVCKKERVAFASRDLELLQALYATPAAVKQKFFFASLNKDTCAEPSH